MIKGYISTRLIRSKQTDTHQNILIHIKPSSFYIHYILSTSSLYTFHVSLEPLRGTDNFHLTLCFKPTALYQLIYNIQSLYKRVMISFYRHITNFFMSKSATNIIKRYRRSIHIQR